MGGAELAAVLNPLLFTIRNLDKGRQARTARRKALAELPHEWQECHLVLDLSPVFSRRESQTKPSLLEATLMMLWELHRGFNGRGLTTGVARSIGMAERVRPNYWSRVPAKIGLLRIILVGVGCGIILFSRTW